MSKPIIVFDFDKTLTEKDTIYGFYRAVSGSGLTFKLKLPFFYLAALLAKLNIISNDTLKEIGVIFYLKDTKKDVLLEKGENYARTIKMNCIYRNEFQDYSTATVIVLSASFEEYLNPLFPNCQVAGSKVLYDKDGFASGLERNLYGAKKLEWIRDKGVKAIDILYTDSYADKPLMDISNCVYLVENNKKRLIKGDHAKINGEMRMNP